VSHSWKVKEVKKYDRRSGFELSDVCEKEQDEQEKSPWRNTRGGFCFKLRARMP
jgi:hypothetical protein